MKPTKVEIENDVPIYDARAKLYQGAVARGNYLSQDRSDIKFGMKETCRSMSLPTEEAYKALKRVGRFLVGKKRLVMKFEAQSDLTLDIYSDSDWAGCPRTRKSTSGGCAMLGGHAINTWSSTQACITLSSGEAEYYALVRATSIGLGLQACLRDLGVEAKIRVHADSAAAIGICKRVGLGKIGRAHV